MPAAVVHRLLDESPHRVWREYRECTLQQIAEAAGISRDGSRSRYVGYEAYNNAQNGEAWVEDTVFAGAQIARAAGGGAVFFAN